MHALIDSPFPEALVDHSGIIVASNAGFAAVFGTAGGGGWVGRAVGDCWLVDVGTNPETHRRMARELLHRGNAYALSATYRTQEGIRERVAFRVLPWERSAVRVELVRITFVPASWVPPAEARWEAESIASMAAMFDQTVALDAARARQAGLAALGLQAARDIPLAMLMELTVETIRDHLGTPMAKVLEHDANAVSHPTDFPHSQPRRSHETHPHPARVNR